VEDVSAKRFILGSLLLLAAAAFALGHLFPGDDMGRRLTMLGGAVGAAILLLLLIRAPDMAVFRILDLPVLRFLGRISYSFYLFNLLCLDVVQRWGPWSHPAGSALTSLEILVIDCLLCAGVASLSYVTIERPFIRWGAQWLEAMRFGKSRPPLA
jgi:peptidoglycan/LPS O-acetylase OafA/YrhL